MGELDDLVGMNVKPFTRARKERRKCEHVERHNTVNYGLERSVCVNCGDVTVRDVGATGTGELFQSLAPVHQR